MKIIRGWRDSVEGGGGVGREYVELAGDMGGRGGGD